MQEQKNRGYSPFLSAQMHYSLLNRDLEDEFIPMASQFGLGLMVWSPLSSGFLSGKYAKSRPKPENGRLNTFDLHLFDREKGYAVVEKVREIANRHGSSVATVSLAWLLRKQYCTTLIIGASKLSQFEENIAAVHLTLEEEEIRVLDEISRTSPRYPALFQGFHDETLRDAKSPLW